MTAQRCEGPLAQIAAEHKDFAFVGLVVAEKKPEQRAFSGAAGAHYGNRLPKVYFETHTGQRRLGTPGVGESDVSKLDGRVTRVRGEVGAVFAFYRCIQEVDYPSGRSGFGSDLCEKTRQPLHGEGHVVQKLEEGEQDSHLDVAPQDHVASDSEYEDKRCEARSKSDRGSQGRHGAVASHDPEPFARSLVIRL